MATPKLRTVCVVAGCSKPVRSKNEDFCVGHIQAWIDAPEREALLRIVTAIGDVASPRWGRVLDVATEIAVKVCAERVGGCR